MTRTFPIAMLLLAACGSKETTTTAAPAEAAAEAPISSDVVPADKASQAFAERLFKTTLSDFRPIDSTGADFIYNSFSLKPDGNFDAKGVVIIADETMECAETGTWSMDPAESNDTASVSWTVDKTNCAGREAGAEHRILLTIDKSGEYTYSFR